jgi:hypothetical protein
MDPFARLGVERGASVGDLRQARRRLAKQLHPDLGDGRSGEAMAEVNRAFDLAVAEPPRPEPGKGSPPPETETATATTFSVDVLPVDACEILIVVCRILGEVLAVDEPYRIEAYLDAPQPCFCSLDLVPEAGGTIVSVDVEAADSTGCPDPEQVRDVLVDEIIELTRPATR